MSKLQPILKGEKILQRLSEAKEDSSQILNCRSVFNLFQAVYADTNHGSIFIVTISIRFNVAQQGNI